MPQPDPLVRLKRAAAERDRASREYREALSEAVKSEGYAAAARAAGVSRQAVRQLLLTSKEAN